MRLPDNAILTRQEMHSVLIQDPRFVHLDSEQIFTELDDFYSEGHRGSLEVREAVPDAFYCAFVQGKAGQLYLAYECIDAIAYRRLVMCCVCGRLHKTNQYRLHVEWQIFLAPKLVVFLDRENGELYQGPDVLCSSCSAPIISQWRRKGYRDKDLSLLIGSLSGVLLDSRARKRIQENAQNWHSARFDPRSRHCAEGID